MPIQWIKDVDTGELYPMLCDCNYEPPAHLEIPEYQTVDYDKTRQMTIEQLQNQLIAAQNHIEAIENEKTSDNNSVETVNDVSAEIISRSEMRLNSDVNNEGKSESFDFLASLKFVGLILFACIVFAMGIYVFAQENDIEINIPNVSEQQTVAEQELEEKQSETEDKNPIRYLLPPLFSVLGIKCAIKIMRGTLESP